MSPSKQTDFSRARTRWIKSCVSLSKEVEQEQRKDQENALKNRAHVDREERIRRMRNTFLPTGFSEGSSTLGAAWAVNIPKPKPPEQWARELLDAAKAGIHIPRDRPANLTPGSWNCSCSLVRMAMTAETNQPVAEAIREGLESLNEIGQSKLVTASNALVDLVTKEIRSQPLKISLPRINPESSLQCLRDLLKQSPDRTVTLTDVIGGWGLRDALEQVGLVDSEVQEGKVLDSSRYYQKRSAETPKPWQLPHLGRTRGKDGRVQSKREWDARTIVRVTQAQLIRLGQEVPSDLLADMTRFLKVDTRE